MDTTSTAWPRYQPLLVALAAFAAGILIDRWLSPPLVPLWIATVATWTAWLVCWLRRRTGWAACAMLLALVALGCLRHHVWWNVYDAREAGRFADETQRPVALLATAVSGSRIVPAPPHDALSTIVQGDRTEIIVRLTAIRHRGRWRPIFGNVRLTVDGHALGINAGDQLHVFAHLSRPPAPKNPGQFDVAAYRRTQRQLCTLFTPNPQCLSVVEPGSWLWPRYWWGKLRDHFDQTLWRNIRQPRAGLAAAILIGAKEQVDQDRKEQFFTTGTVHLLAISGLHVGILAYLFSVVLRTGVLGRRSALVATILLVVLYASLTDARPPVVRATILIVIVCVGHLFGRPALSFNTLSAAAVVVLAVNPAQLFLAGTQLSFLAVATLMCGAPWLAPQPIEDPLDRLIAESRPRPIKLLRRLATWFGRALLAGTLLWIVALPLVLYHYHLVSPVATVLNPLLMIPMLFALLFGFGVLLFGWLAPPLAWASGWICDKCFLIIELLVQLARPIYGSHFFSPSPAWWWILLTYVGLGLFVGLRPWRPPVRWCLAILMGVGGGWPV